MKKLLCAALLAEALGGPALAAALLTNGDFEIGGPTDAAGWGPAHGCCSYVAGAGRNGTRALFCNVTRDAPRQLVSQPVDLKPGARYLVEGWIRTEDVAGGANGNGGVKLSVQWRTADGKPAVGKFSRKKTGTSAGWEKMSFGVLVPENAVDCRFEPVFQHGVTGRAWFDDLSIRPIDRRPIGAVVSDAWRNVAVSGTVRLTATVILPSAEQADLRGEFAVPCADGSVVRLPAVFEGAYARASFDVARLAPGKSEIVFRLTDARGETLDTQALGFTRAAELPRFAVRMDRGRLTVDGRPFFPMGVFLRKIDAESLAEVAKGAFNCVLAYNSPTREQLDMAQAAGLKVIYSIKGTYFGTRACKRVITSEEEEYGWIRRCVEACRDHPALLAWYVNDELSVEYRDRLAKHHAFVSALDPGHPTFSVLYQTDDYPEYVGTFDVIGCDTYPIGNPDAPAPLSRVTDDARLAVAAACGGGVWQVPQLFDWVCFRPDAAAKTHAPTADELRNMFWQNVAAGATGLVPFSLESMRQGDSRTPFDGRWRTVCDLTREIAAFSPVILSDEPAPAVRGLPTGVVARTWRHLGRDYLLAVNLLDRPADVTLEIAGHGRVEIALKPIGVERRALDAPCPADRPVLAINEDNDHYFKQDASRMTRASLLAYVDEILSSGRVTDFLMCPCGQRASFDSKAWEPIWAGLGDPDEKGRTNNIWCANAKLLRDRGIDPYSVWLARCREKGVRGWLSMRMNDVHFVRVPNYFRNTTFWRTRPDLRRRPDLDPAKTKAPWEDFAFDYIHEEVRDYHFAMFRELVERYDADGYELDWMRFTQHLTPGRERELADVLTEFVRRCRACVREAAARRGHPVLLSVRVPRTLAEAEAKGMDPLRWAKEGLVDWIVPTAFYEKNDYAIDVEDWMRRVAAVNPKVRILPGATDKLCRGRKGEPPTDMSADDFRLWAEAMRLRGATGLYLFNVPYLPAEVRACAYGGLDGRPSAPAASVLTVSGRTDRPVAEYGAGETMTFTLAVDGAAGGVRAGWQIKWRRTGDEGKSEEGLALADRPFVYRTSLDRPGFVRLNGTLVDAEGKAVRTPDALGRRVPVVFDLGAGVDIRKIRPSVPAPDDFDALWAEHKAKLAAVAWRDGVVLREIPSTHSGTRLYAFSVPCCGGKPATGHLSVPKDASRRHPATVKFFGYNESWTYARSICPPKNLTTDRLLMFVSAHGFEMGHDEAYYKAEREKVKSNGHGHAFDPEQNADPERAYFAGMTYRLLRALEYLKSRPEWDGRELTVRGGSQGGLQAIWAAALDPDVTTCDIFIPWCCDLAGPANGRNHGDWHLQWVPGLGYYDACSMAPRIPGTCTVRVSMAGFGDYICPPTGVMAFYNALVCPKEITFVQNAQHGNLLEPCPQKFKIVGDGAPVALGK